MASTYSDLKFELIGTGEQSGTWGTTTNTNLGTAIEEAITGSADVSFSSADVTLTLTDTNGTQTARNLRLNLTGTSGGARNLIVPAIEKFYIVNNGLADACTVKVSGQTGVSVPAGKAMLLFNNSTDVVDAVTHFNTASVGTLTLTNALAVAQGGTGATSASAARTNLGAQAQDDNLDDIAGLTPTDGNIIVGDGSNFVAESGATARTSLGAQAQDDNLDDIAGLTPTDGNIIVGDGTNFVAESGATARTSLGLGDLATLDSVDASTIDDNSVGADELNVSGDGTAGQALVSDGDGTMTWSTVGGDAPLNNAQVFVANGTWTAPTGVNRARVLVIGGGAGGSKAGPGRNGDQPGGNGGICHAIVSVTPGTTYNITVGAGGAGVARNNNQNANANGGNGGVSRFHNWITANGGNGAASANTGFNNGQRTGNVSTNTGTVIRAVNVNNTLSSNGFGMGGRSRPKSPDGQNNNRPAVGFSVNGIYGAGRGGGAHKNYEGEDPNASGGGGVEGCVVVYF